MAVLKPTIVGSAGWGWGSQMVPPPGTLYRLHAPIAHSAERLHGKEKVYGSIPYWGSEYGPISAVGSDRAGRGSSAWQSKRLIIAVSRVQVPPPLPTATNAVGKTRNT